MYGIGFRAGCVLGFAELKMKGLLWNADSKVMGCNNDLILYYSKKYIPHYPVQQ